jgi:hypothetical protein
VMERVTKIEMIQLEREDDGNKTLPKDEAEIG